MSRRQSCLPFFLLLPLLCLSRRALFWGEQFAFRDASHYYPPFYEYINQRWQAGLPLWSPLENLGQPLLADPTAAVVYPAKLIFCLPLEFEQTFAIYVVLHLWLAGLGMYRYAREIGANRCGALIGAFSYELSGQVLFQYCNPIFCIGAAWLPWALVFGERLGGYKNRAHLFLAICLSMMVLGGDPQMAYHCVLVLAVRSLFFKDSWRPDRNVNKAAKPTSRRLLTGVIAAAVIAIVLSAMQVLPSVEWSSSSDRILDEPTTIWGYYASNENRHFTDWFLNSSTASNNHASRVYDFSVGPWRWIELVWPNVSGQLFPQNGRWIGLLPSEKRMWVPSLYLGFPTLLLSIVGMIRSCKSGRFAAGRWLTCLAVLSMFAAMGEYGVGWVANEIRYAVSPAGYQPGSMHPSAGGLYWLLVKLLPGYGSFRYPAKWWTIATIAICGLAAKGWPTMRLALARGGIQRPLKRCVIGLLSASIAIAIVAAMLMRSFGNESNSIFGPFCQEVAWRSIVKAFVHVSALVVVSQVLLRYSFRNHRASSVVRRCFWVVVAIELSVAQWSLVQTIETDHVDRSSAEKLVPAPSASMWSDDTNLTNTTIYRSSAESAYPNSWRQTSDPHRLAQLRHLELATLMPKHHLTQRSRSVLSNVSMASSDYMGLWHACRQHPSGDPPLELLALLGVETILAPANAYPLDAQPPPGELDTPLVQFNNPSPFPRTWLVEDWSKVELGSDNPKHAAERVLLNDGSIRDLRRTALMETNQPLPSPQVEEPHAREQPQGTCKIIEAEPERVVIEAHVAKRSLLVLADQFYPGWEASLRTSKEGSSGPRHGHELPILRTNRVMRGVLLEPGDHTVVFRYRPRSVFAGLAISGLGWLLLGATIWRRSPAS